MIGWQAGLPVPGLTLWFALSSVACLSAPQVKPNPPVSVVWTSKGLPLIVPQLSVAWYGDYKRSRNSLDLALYHHWLPFLGPQVLNCYLLTCFEALVTPWCVDRNSASSDNWENLKRGWACIPLQIDDSSHGSVGHYLTWQFVKCLAQWRFALLNHLQPYFVLWSLGIFLRKENLFRYSSSPT